ncbi:MAG: TonB-dependent receptor, partial [Caulobacterales bacterium]|nr:TonB-dependent receptor [Caulobacterales bacterium]
MKLKNMEIIIQGLRMSKIIKKKLRNLLLISSALSFSSVPLFAQEIDCFEKTTCNSKAVNNNDELVIISAPLRTTNFATPYSVSKIGAENLKNANVKKAQDLIQIVPSLQFPQSESALSVTARIRGIGTQGTNVGLEPSVGIMIDGVMRTRTAAGFGDLGELSSIEVARGPQSVFYGSNVSAGLIYITTKIPNETFEANSFISLGNFNYQNWGASINGGLSENLSGRLFFTSAMRDGYMLVNEGLSNQRKDNNINYYSTRGQLFYKAGKTNFRLIADYTKRNEACCNAPVYISDSRAPVNSTTIINRIFQNGKYPSNQFEN